MIVDTLLKIRGVAKKIYSEYETPIRIIIKFLFVLWTLNYATEQLGYYEMLNLLPIRLFVAVICGFLPVAISVFLVAVIVLLHLFKLSVFVGALSAVVFIIAYFLYLKFAPAQGIFVLAIIVLMPLHLQYAAALLLGLFFGPATIVPAAMAVIIVSYLGFAKQAVETIGTGLNVEGMMGGYQQIVDGVIGDKDMLLMIVVLAVVIVLAYVISRMPFDYSWYAAIGAAAIAGIIVDAVGAGMLGAESNFAGTVGGMIVGVIVAVIAQFFKCIVDYPKKQFVQFEDDDYYYYVKAVPKLGVSEEYVDEDEDDEEEPYDEVKPSRAKPAKTRASKATASKSKASHDAYAGAGSASRSSARPSAGMDDYGDTSTGSSGTSSKRGRSRASSASEPDQIYDDMGFGDYDFFDDEPKF